MKQLEPWRGQPLVRHAVEVAEGVCGERCLLVVGHRWQEVLAACRPLPGFLALNDAYQEGIGASIRCGVKRVAHAADAVILLLADQPLINSQHLDPLFAACRTSPDSIVACRYANILGPPIVFPKRDFGALTALKGDAGARSVVAAAGERVISVHCDAAAVDVDRPEDLAALNGKSSS